MRQETVTNSSHAPEGVTIHDGDLFIADAGNNRIMRCYMVAGRNLCVLVAGLAGDLDHPWAVAVLDAPTTKLTTTTSSRSTTTRNEPDVTEAAVAMVSQGGRHSSGLLLFVTNLRILLLPERSWTCTARRRHFNRTLLSQ